MKRFKKGIIILIILMSMLFLISNIVYGESPINDFKKHMKAENTEDIKDFSATVLGIIRVVGTIISVGMIMVLGIKYMMGSAEQKAEYKKNFLPYIIGAVLLFAATNIADVIYNSVQGK